MTNNKEQRSELHNKLTLQERLVKEIEKVLPKEKEFIEDEPNMFIPKDSEISLSGAYGYNQALSEIDKSLLAQTCERVVKESMNKLDRYELGGYPEEGYCMEVSSDGEYIKIEDLLNILK